MILKQRFPFIQAGLLTALLLMGCGSINEVNVPAPKTADLETEVSIERAFVSVVLSAEEGALPEDVQSTRFTVAELWFKPKNGDWIKRPAEREPFQVTGTARPTRTLLGADLPVASYDSLALVINNVYVEYGPNAGGPLTVREDPLILPLQLTTEANRLATVTLRYDPAASLRRRPITSRWVFDPAVSVVVDTTASVDTP